MEGLGDKEFIQNLRFIRPSSQYNKKLLKEIERRGIYNDLYVFAYLKELMDLGLCKFEVQSLLLTNFDISDKISKFITSEKKYVEIERGTYNINKVAKSIKENKLGPDFEEFIDSVEFILMSTRRRKVNSINNQVISINNQVISINNQVISDFINLVRRFRRRRIHKRDKPILKDLMEGRLSFRETWLYVFRSRLLGDSVLFVFYFLCLDNLKTFKYQILRNMIEELIGGEDLEIFEESWGRLRGYLEKDIFSTFSEEYKEKEPVAGKPNTAGNNPNAGKADKEVLDWYKERVEAFKNKSEIK